MRPPPVLVAGILSLAVLVAGALSLPARAQLSSPEPDTGWEAKQSLLASRQMVVAANGHAADAGIAILREGGSALDAAVTVQLVLGLVEPQSSGIGGGGFLLHWSQRERRVRSYDGRETAPAAARPDRFLDDDGQPRQFMQVVASGRSVGVPGVLRMLELAHKKHGKLPWARLFAPAIRLAEAGFPMSRRLHLLAGRDPYLRRDRAARDLYFGADGLPKPIGATIVNAAYAETLREIAEGGADAFYQGPIAADMVRAVRANRDPGDLAAGDLLTYAAIERNPVCGSYRGWRVCGMAPPSSGGVALLQMLALLERKEFHRTAAGSTEAVHLFSEAARLAYADRAHYIADPQFVVQPVAGLLDSAYLDARARLIGERSLGPAYPGVPRGAGARPDPLDAERVGTTHFSIVDAAGDAVSMTSSVEHFFGSRIMVRGFLLNNQLTDFAFSPEFALQPVANRVDAGKRPRSTMSPTLVFDAGGALRLALGSAGGATIVNHVAKVIVGVRDWGLDVQAAVELPNFGSIGGPTFIERGSDYERLGDALGARGHVLNFPRTTSGLHAMERTAAGWASGADPRREGAARGD